MPQSGAAFADTSSATDSPVAAVRLAVRRLVLTHFRNYASLRLELDGRPVVLTGANGAGKTNLLEAVSLLTPGRGLRNARLEDLPPHSASDGAWGVAAAVETPGGPVDLGTGVVTGEARRQVRIDGKQARGQTALAPYCAAVWLTPQMDRLFLDGAEERRRFLDRLVFGADPAHAGRVTAYQNTRRQRQRLLADGGDPAWLDALERTLAQRAVAIAAGRLDLARRLDRAAAEGDEGPFPTPRIAAVGDVEQWLADHPALAVEDRLAEAWQRNRRDDAATGQTSLGPHRSDMAVWYAGRDVPAAQCSTGEQKALLIGLILASARMTAAERGAQPLVLLDEIAAHLDPGRREALYRRLLESGAQVWLTGTEPALFEPLGESAQYFRVADGHVTPTTGAAPS
ncbi:MAG: DNA replication/repair protein RecF [Alphaproteobacteria bacterium]|nr:DNA replication/repair protein RecF [Alphaproteobacteria bacterium]